MKISNKSNSSFEAFSLIELMAALAIGLIMLTLLYNSITRTYKAVSSIEQSIDIHSAIALYLERFEKDVTAAFVPAQARFDLRKNKQKNKQESDNSKEAIKKPNMSRVFLLKNMKNGANGELSFVTTSSLNIYNKAASPLVRVLYKLEKPASSSNSQEKLWKLMRYESSELDYDHMRSKLGKEVRGFEILSNIDAFSVECTASTESSKANNNSSDFESFNEWDSDNRKQENQFLLPNFVRCAGTATEGKKAVSFEFVVPIYAYNSQLAADIKKEQKTESLPLEKKNAEKQAGENDEKNGETKQSSLLANLLKSL